MKFVFALSIIILSLSMASCGHKKERERAIRTADSLRIVSEKIYQNHLSELSKVREELYGPVRESDGVISVSEKFKTFIMDDSTTYQTSEFEKLKAKLEQAQKDSTTLYGALLTRFRLLDTQHKYLTATYTDNARMLRYTSEINFDDKHEEERDFYFSNDTLTYYREHHTFSREDIDYTTDDSYFLKNCNVTYSYRDEGSAPSVRDKMSVMVIKRYKLQGDIVGHVAKEFVNFKKDYDILLTQPLESLLYPGPSAIK